jgi:hypothetical protein
MERVSGFTHVEEESNKLITTQKLGENKVFIIKPSQNPILNEEGHCSHCLLAPVSQPGLHIRERPSLVSDNS